VQAVEKAGAELVLLAYPANFYATESRQIYDYTKAFCDATQLGVILFPVPHWGFERIHPAGMDPELVKADGARHPQHRVHQGRVRDAHARRLRAGVEEPLARGSGDLPVEGDALPLAALVPMQFSGTSNTEFYGDTMPRMFRLVREASSTR